MNLVMKTFEEHEKNFDPNNMKDFLDLTISELHANKVPPNSFLNPHCCHNVFYLGH